MARIRGLELLFELKRINIRSKTDCLIAAIHCMLINENLQCVGRGERFDNTQDRVGSDLLPDRWNDNQEEYNLRYTSRDGQNRCLLNAIAYPDSLSVYVIVNDRDRYGLPINIDRYVTDDFLEYDSAYRNLEELINSFEEEIICKIREDNPIVHLDSRESFPRHPGPSNPSRRKKKSEVLSIEDVDPPQIPNLDPDSERDRKPPNLPKVGGRDLDPTGQQPGSMHFDPSTLEEDPTPVRPREKGSPDPENPSVPPGARYDPIGPVKGPDKGNPDPDHLRKPPDGHDGKL